MFKIKSNKQGGFTLIEMMVAVSIFAIVALITSGSFIIMADLFRKVQTNRAVIDNLNLAMDTMAFQIREGKDFNFSCGDGVEDCIEFDELYLADGVIETTRRLRYKMGTDDVLQCEIDGGEECQALTSTEIKVEELRFIRDTSSLVPRVTVILSGVATSKVGLSSDFLLQTTLSLRNFSG